MKKLFPILCIVLITLVFFWQFIFRGLLPIPSDTIIGLYHPFRDLYAKSYPNGIPFKNFLITDSVRQQYPWRNLAVSLEKKLQFPLWNPYSFSGTPLLSNFQSASFYPLNILFFIFPFSFSWGLLIFLQPLLGILFLYLYLENLRINKYASILGAIAFGFSGFFVAWIEWGTILQVAIWLPLILLSVDKIVSNIKNKKTLLWSLIYVFSLISSFFAGHLQTFFYLMLVSTFYFFARFLQHKKNKNILFVYLILNTLFLILTSIQWFPTLQLILLSARDVDLVNWQNSGWFIPWQHLIQFVAPDFFGNPATLNYWGVWNYGEFIGYIGIFPLLTAFFALFFRHDKKTLFFGTLFFISLIFALPTIFAKVPFILHIPFVDTAQPTRLLFVTDFSLAVLSAFGFDYFIRKKNREILYILLFLFFIFFGLWLFVVFGNEALKAVLTKDILVAKRNLLFPTLIFVVSATLLFGLLRFPRLYKNFTIMIYIIIVLVAVFDLLRFGFKFTPFTKKEHLFPETKVISFLQQQEGQFRIMAVDSRIFPPNFSVIYGLQSIDGYDPLYLKRYGELIAASERQNPDISPPFGFNRIITPHNYDSTIIDLLGVRYVLSLSDISSPKLNKVFQEGKTKIYKNKDAMPRTFFVKNLEIAKNNKEAIGRLFQTNFDLRKSAVVEGINSTKTTLIEKKDWSLGKAEIIEYLPNKIVINTDNAEGFLVLTDSFYPTWHAQIDASVKLGQNEVKIYRADYNFRGIFVPSGKHIITFYNTLL